MTIEGLIQELARQISWAEAYMGDISDESDELIDLGEGTLPSTYGSSPLETSHPSSEHNRPVFTTALVSSSIPRFLFKDEQLQPKLLGPRHILMLRLSVLLAPPVRRTETLSIFESRPNAPNYARPLGPLKT